MEKDDEQAKAARESEIERLEGEAELLSRQVKRLIKAEGRLYAYQEELDAQLKQYKDLYELSKRVTATTAPDRLMRETVEYAVRNLDYERALFLVPARERGEYRVGDLEGYYEAEQRGPVAGLTVPCAHRLLALLCTEQEQLICVDEETETDLLAWRKLLGLHEFYLYPLGPRETPLALLAVGNSAARKQFHRRVECGAPEMLGLGNMVSLISTALESQHSYVVMVHALEQVRLAEARYRSIFENAVEGMFRISRAGRYLAANPSLAHMMGYASPEELMAAIGEVQGIYLFQEQRVEMMRRLEQQGTISGYEVQVYRKDRSVIWLSVNARAVRDANDAVLYYDGSAENIDQRKKAEEALRQSEQRYRQLSESLEQRVRQSVDELRQKDQILIAQSRQALMGEMIANIAHQWRQPLNLLGLLAQELPLRIRQGSCDLECVEASTKKSMNLIRHMSKTIDDFRFFFLTDQGKEKYRVLENIHRTVSLVEGSLDPLKIRIAIEAEIDPVLDGYPNDFTQVLVNLINNAREAFEHSRPEHPEIAIRVTGRDGETVVTVTDNAGGIPPELLDKIFEPYFTTKGPAGTGIGLFMSKTIIEKKMHGTLRVRNVAKGAEFTIRI